MSDILSLAMRPKRLSDLVGQGAVVKAIQKQATTRLPPAFLFHGGPGVGKTSLAYIVSVALQCKHQKVWGEPCDACWAKWSELSIQEVNASEVNGVEEIGKVAEMSRYRPTPPSLKRVIILDEAQLMSNSAQNLLLKYLEPKTAGSTLWILATTAPNKIIAALKRRCVGYQLKPLSFEDREKFLVAAGKEAKVKNISALVECANEAHVSSPGILLMALEKYASGIPADEAVASTEGTPIDTREICRTVTAGEWRGLRKAMEKVSPDEARWVRSAVLGWLRGCLVREANKARRSVIADCMVELTTVAPLEDGLLLQWLWARLYRVCTKLG